LMGADGPGRNSSAAGDVLRWTGRVLTAEDLRHSLNGHREVVLPAHAVITPLAAEQIRANGIRVSRQTITEQSLPRMSWGYAQERPHTLVQSAIRSLEREGMLLKDLGLQDRSPACRWAHAVAECVARGECWGGVIFCDDAGLLCCVANKVAGLRATVANTVSQAARATLTLGANLVAVEMPGRTFFEVRQIIRTVCSAAAPACPAGVACTLKELDGHAHR
jgi:ribose 5-phosphate isomerase RpiB